MRAGTGWQVSLKAVLPFVEGALRAAEEQQRNAAVVKSLRRSENLHVREDITRCKQRWAGDVSHLLLLICCCQLLLQLLGYGMPPGICMICGPLMSSGTHAM